MGWVFWIFNEIKSRVIKQSEERYFYRSKAVHIYTIYICVCVCIYKYIICIIYIIYIIYLALNMATLLSRKE
jgi:hypothetical protein